MSPDPQKILTLAQQGEGISLEFKESRSSLSRDVYETVCAFLNRHGGTLLLGVKDNGEITGVDPDCVERVKKDFVNTLNNPQKISPAAYLSVDEVPVDGKRYCASMCPRVLRFTAAMDASTIVTKTVTLISPITLFRWQPSTSASWQRFRKIKYTR